MNASTLLADLHRRGIKLSVSGERLSIDAPKGSVTPDLRSALTEHKPDLIRLLTEDEHEVAWRAEFMRTQLPPSGPIPFLVARPSLSDVRGLCLSCDAPLSEGRTVRCALCVRAAEQVLNERREGLRSLGAR
jgi:hypothetical protein